MSADPVPVRDDLLEVEPYGAPQLDVAVQLNTNEPPYPPPAAYTELLCARLGGLRLNRYPDRRAWGLRGELGARFGVPPEEVWAANGSNEVLAQLFQAYGGADRTLLLFRPGYSAHPLIAKVAGTPVVEADLDAGFSLSAGAARAAVQAHDPDIVCIARPNAPTGVSIPFEAVRALHDSGRGLVIIDEAYAEFAVDDVTALRGELPRLVVTRTFSKAWRLAGARLGYMLAPPWVVDGVRRVRLPYHLDALTQAAGLAALELEKEMTAHVPEVIAERDRIRGALLALGLEVAESSGNFLLFRSTATDLFDRLLAKGVLVRDFSSAPRLEGALRVTVGTPEENDRFVNALEESLI